MPWTAIVNPAAGRGRTRRLLPDLTRTFADAPDDVIVEVSGAPGEPTRLANVAADAGRDLVACGGDGAVSDIAGVAADRGVRLAIVPTGAGNDFARTLGYDTKHPLQAVGVLAKGEDRVVDLGRANDRWYTCVTATGFDAEANRWANTVTRLSGTTLYVAAVLRTLLVYRPCPFRVTVDGTVHETPAWMVAVGNSRAYAGGMQIVPDARMDDGLLDVCVIGNLNRIQILRHFPKVFRGAHLAVPGIQTFRGSKITVEALGDRAMEVWADGERV